MQYSWVYLIVPALMGLWGSDVSIVLISIVVTEAVVRSSTGLDRASVLKVITVLIVKYQSVELTVK